MDPWHDGDADPVIAALIRRKAKRLSATRGFHAGDEEDLRQDLWLNVVRAMQTYDPHRASRRTFAARIITTRSISMAKQARAEKRDGSRVRALDSLLDPPAQRREPSPDHISSQLDVHDMLARLPADLHPIATLFMKHGRESGVIRESGMSRQRVRGMRRRLAEHLQALA
jgi:DNA-directed RNA polymerase specialized sigma24 family protein